MSNTVAQMSDPSLRKLGKNVGTWLNYRSLKPTKKNVCDAISKTDQSKWKGINPRTLRDNVYRPPGSYPRRKREEERAQKAMREKILEGLKRSRDSLVEGEEPKDD